MARPRGHIHKRSRSSGKPWRAYLTLGTDPVTGKRRRPSKSFATELEAQRWLTAQLERLDRGAFIAPNRLTVGQYLVDYWLPSMVGKVTDVTHRSYSSVVHHRLLPDLGSVPLQELSGWHVERCYRELAERGLSARSVRYAHTLLKKALKDAVRRDLVPRNAADSVDAPRVGTGSRNAERVWNAEQARVFLQAVKDDYLHAAWLLLLTTGIRRGELCGLAWDAVDLDNGEFAIRQTIKSLPGEIAFGEPKSAASRRVVQLDAGTVEALREHRRRQLEARMQLGPDYNPHRLVFVRKTGEPIHPDALTSRFQRLVAKVEGVPPITLHGLRHTHATLGLKAGVSPKIVQARLGHSTVALTLNVYSHVTRGMDREAADTIASALHT